MVKVGDKIKTSQDFHEPYIAEVIKIKKYPHPDKPEPEPNLFPIPDKPLDQELEEYANGFWRFYDKRPLLGNFVLGVIIIGLMYVFFLVSNFISETTGEKHWLAAIITEPYEQIVPVISMLFSKKDKK